VLTTVFVQAKGALLLLTCAASVSLGWLTIICSGTAGCHVQLIVGEELPRTDDICWYGTCEMVLGAAVAIHQSLTSTAD
jgi:hypothetical protein